MVGCAVVGSLVGTGLIVGDLVPSKGAGVGEPVGRSVFGTITPSLQSA